MWCHSSWMDGSIWHCPISDLWKIQLTVACLSHSLQRSPVVHHWTSTILTSVVEISCQAFILLRDQGLSCSYLNITLFCCRFDIAGAGGISFMSSLKTQNASAWPLGFGGIIWRICILQQLLVRSHQGSKTGSESCLCSMVTFIFHLIENPPLPFPSWNVVLCPATIYRCDRDW